MTILTNLGAKIQMHFDFFPAKKKSILTQKQKLTLFSSFSRMCSFCTKKWTFDTLCLWAISEKKIQFCFDWNIFFFAGRVSLTDEASDEELTKGLYHVEGDSTGLVRNPVAQVKKLLKIALESSNYAIKRAKVTFLRKMRNSKVIWIIIRKKAK